MTTQTRPRGAVEHAELRRMLERMDASTDDYPDDQRAVPPAVTAASAPLAFKFNKSQERWPPGAPGGLGGQWKDDDSPFGSVPVDAARGSTKLRRTVSEYRGQSGQQLNATLRGWVPRDDKKLDDMRETLDEALADSKLTADVRTHRGVNNLDRIFGEPLPMGDATGFTWRDDGFPSTTVVADRAHEFAADNPLSPGAVLHITVPEGTRALKISDVNDEGELLLDRGLSYRVVRDNGTVNGVRDLDVEVIDATKLGTVNTPEPVPGGKPVKPAIIYKKHADGAVVAQRGTRRLRWDAGAKKFADEERQNDTWVERRQLTKTAAYAEMKKGDWTEPGSEMLNVPTDAIVPELGDLSLPEGVEWIDLNELVGAIKYSTDPHNWRQPNAMEKFAEYKLAHESAKGLLEDVRENGMQPIQITWDDVPTGQWEDGKPVTLRQATLVNGGHRLAAAYRLGLTKVPISTRDLEDWDSQTGKFKYPEPDLASSETPELEVPVVEPGVETPGGRFNSPTSAHISMTPAQREIDSRIRLAFSDLQYRTDLPETTKVGLNKKTPHRTMREGGYVGFADLREKLSDVPRGELDVVLNKIITSDSSVYAAPESAQYGLLDRDRKAALSRGNQDKHWLEIMPEGLPTKLDTTSVAEATTKTTQTPGLTGRAGIGTDQTEWISGQFSTNSETFFGDEAQFGPGDGSMVPIAERQGFAETPRLGTSKQLDDAIKTGGVELWRGVAAISPISGDTVPERTRTIVDEFKRGRYMPGRGLYGNGYYTSVKRTVSRMFAAGDDTGVMRMVLDPDARIIDFEDLGSLVQKMSGNPDIHPELAFSWGQDPGHTALMLGYDAVRIRSKDDGSSVYPGSGNTYADQYIVLNRGALLVED